MNKNTPCDILISQIFTQNLGFLVELSWTGKLPFDQRQISVFKGIVWHFL